jgi:hypothetical protein
VFDVPLVWRWQILPPSCGEVRVLDVGDQTKTPVVILGQPITNDTAFYHALHGLGKLRVFLSGVLAQGPNSCEVDAQTLVDGLRDHRVRTIAERAPHEVPDSNSSSRKCEQTSFGHVRWSSRQTEIHAKRAQKD